MDQATVPLLLVSRRSPRALQRTLSSSGTIRFSSRDLIDNSELTQRCSPRSRACIADASTIFQQQPERVDLFYTQHKEEVRTAWSVNERESERLFVLLRFSSAEALFKALSEGRKDDKCLVKCMTVQDALRHYRRYFARQVESCAVLKNTFCFAVSAALDDRSEFCIYCEPMLVSELISDSNNALANSTKPQ